jgi:hypothetical protein
VGFLLPVWLVLAVKVCRLKSNAASHVNRQSGRYFLSTIPLLAKSPIKQAENTFGDDGGCILGSHNRLLSVSTQRRTTMNTVRTEKGQLSILVLSTTGRMPVRLQQVKQLLDSHPVCVQVLPMERFCAPDASGLRLEAIGTVIIDAAPIISGGKPGPDVFAECPTTASGLRRVIEMLDAADIGVIVLDAPEGLELEDFELAAAVCSEDIEQLWGRICANLAYRARISRSRSGPRKADTSGPADSLAEQLKMAGRVQRDFLPAQLPNNEKFHWATIFRPAQWVSGDIYDVTRLDERHIGFYVADAVGHSMPAALLTMFLKQAMVMRRTIGNKYRVFEPVEVIGDLNRQMVQQKLSGCQFATCCYCIVNSWTLQLTFARAGHPYPVLIRCGEGVRHLESRGALLGVFEHSQYNQEKIQLQAGDKLLLYSDGAEALIGATNESGQFAFSEEFCEISHLPVEQMLQELERRIAGEPQPQGGDDVTVIGLQVVQ